MHLLSRFLSPEAARPVQAGGEMMFLSRTILILFVRLNIIFTPLAIH